MKKIVLFLYCLIMTIGLNAQTSSFTWAKRVGVTPMTLESDAIALDASGNVYTIGSFYGTVDFDPGAGITTLTSNSNSEDVFISKLNAAGNFIWAKSFSGSGSEKGYAIKVDGSGNVYVTGWFNGTVDFDPGAGNQNLTPTPTGNYYSSYIAKLDVSGNFVWAKQFTGGGVYAQAIALDASNNVYSTGMFTGTSDFDPGVSTVNLSSAVSNPVGASDIFISKLDAGGNFVYVKQVSGASVDWAFGIYVDATGKIYLTGKFIGTVDFDPGSGTTNLVAQGYYDIFVLKLDASGSFAWAKSFGGAAAIDYGLSIAVDNLGNVYSTGYFSGTSDFDPGAGTSNLLSAGSQDIFVSKLDASGTFMWARRLGGTLDDAGNAITVDAYRNIYVTGTFQNSADFDPGAGTMTLTSAGGKDVFIIRFNEFGNTTWAKSFGGTSDEEATGIAVNTAGDVYTTGAFKGAVDFDPGSATFNMTSQGNKDVFVHKMSQNTIGIKRMDVSEELVIYPNPANGLFNITLANNTGGSVIEIYNSLGVLVHSQCAGPTNTVDISAESDGLYIVKVITGNDTVISKIIVKQ